MYDASPGAVYEDSGFDRSGFMCRLRRFVHDGRRYPVVALKRFCCACWVKVPLSSVESFMYDASPGAI